jgi:hypothetical protein
MGVGTISGSHCPNLFRTRLGFPGVSGHPDFSHTNNISESPYLEGKPLGRVPELNGVGGYMRKQTIWVQIQSSAQSPPWVSGLRKQ